MNEVNQLLKRLFPKRRISVIVAILSLLLSVTPSTALAHNYSASFTNLKINPNKTEMVFSIDSISIIELASGIDRNKDYVLDNSEIKLGRHHLEELLTDTLALDKNNKELTPTLEKLKLVKKQNKIFLSCYFHYIGFSPGDTISLNDGFYSGDSGTTNYVNLLSAEYPGGTSEAALQGNERTWTMLLTENQQEQTTTEGQALSQNDTKTQAPVAVAQNAGTHNTSSWLSFLKLGIFHILSGYDHLLFLLALLITRQSLKQYFGTVTAFTIAHSITLTLAVLGWVDLPVAIVEPLIALSICYVAIENIVKKKINYRWIITFIFGLVHGLGFAGILKDMDLPKSRLAVALVNFNLGIEFIQLLIVLIVLPVLLKLQKSKNYNIYVKIGSIFIFILGSIWLFQRI